MKKLIEEYNSKIEDMDKGILGLTERIKVYRRHNLPSIEYQNKTSHLVSERKVYEAKRQCYVQFIKDLESLDNK